MKPIWFKKVEKNQYKLAVEAQQCEEIEKKDEKIIDKGFAVKRKLWPTKVGKGSVNLAVVALVCEGITKKFGKGFRRIEEKIFICREISDLLTTVPVYTLVVWYATINKCLVDLLLIAVSSFYFESRAGSDLISLAHRLI